MAQSRSVSTEIDREPGRCIRLQFYDVIRLEPSRLSRLCSEQGPAAARQELHRLRSALIRERESLVQNFSCGRTGDVERRAAGLVGLADDLGLPALRDAALNLAECAAAPDPTALSATFARVCRLADAAIVGLPPLAGSASDT